MLGANDGIVSTASLIVGIAATTTSTTAIVTAGAAGLVAGALSMAAGEYVSVSSQRDAEHADVARERRELAEFPEAELRELTEIYVNRGLDRELAGAVARQLHEHDALESHLRDELGLDASNLAQPVLAATTSASAFAVGALIPLLAAILGGRSIVVAAIAVTTLAALGLWSARIGGASQRPAAFRVVIGGALAMGISAALGSLIGATV